MELDQKNIGKKNKWGFVAPILIFIFILIVTIAIIQLVSFGIDALRVHFGIPVADNGGGSTTTIAANTQMLQDIKKSITPYDFKENLSKSQIINNFKNSSVKNAQTATFNKSLIVVGKFSRGYLYVRASVGNKALGPNDDVYIKISGKVNGIYVESGGHLIADRSLDTPKNVNSTELLFDLTDVKFKEHFTQSPLEVTSADWLNILNQGNTQVVIAFSSTMGQGDIEEMSIYYECNGDTCSIK
jgi:hypothetical protein